LLSRPFRGRRIDIGGIGEGRDGSGEGGRERRRLERFGLIEFNIERRETYADMKARIAIITKTVYHPNPRMVTHIYSRLRPKSGVTPKYA
jgi:hypothetical protein